MAIHLEGFIYLENGKSFKVKRERERERRTERQKQRYKQKKSSVFRGKY